MPATNPDATGSHAPAQPGLAKNAARALVPLALVAVGAWMISRWAAVWQANPDYAHGWAVPVLAGYLAWERWADRPGLRSESSREGTVAMEATASAEATSTAEATATTRATAPTPTTASTVAEPAPRGARRPPPIPLARSAAPPCDASPQNSPRPPPVRLAPSAAPPCDAVPQNSLCPPPIWWLARSAARPCDAPPHTSPRPPPPWIVWTAVALLGVSLLALRLVLEPFPQWPLALWMFSAVGYVAFLGVIALTYGTARARHFVFPVLFTAAALPWPSAVDVQVIHPLRELLAAIAGEVVNLWGYPAIVHGTVIEIGRGLVGVDEACSGVRSLQTALMVSLFLGEFYRFTWPRRVGVLLIGIGLALATNLARTVFLALQGAIDGPAGVDRWHDQAGNAQLAVALGGLVLMAWRWSVRTPSPAAHAGPAAGSLATGATGATEVAGSAVAPGSATATAVAEPAIMAVPRGGSTPRVSATSAGSATPPGKPVPLGRPAPLGTRFALAVLACVLIAEAGTQAWYALGDRRQRTLPQWTAALPRQAAGFREDAFTPSMQAMLGCDAHDLGQWRSAEGHARAGYVLEWHAGQTARFAPTLHNPTVCLPMSGSTLLDDLGVVSLQVPGGQELPFRGFVFQRGGEVYHVFYLAWDLTSARPLAAGTTTAESGLTAWIGQQWQDVRDARRSLAARVLTLAIYSAPDVGAARAAAEAELAAIVKAPGA